MSSADLLEHLKKMRRAAADRRFGGHLLVGVGVFVAVMGFFFGPSIPFAVIGIIVAIVGGIIAGAARRRIEDIDAQIIQAS